MAYSLGDRENQQILEEIKQMASCPICGCEYDEHTNRPKVLPCPYKRHTLCKVCIEKQIQHSCIHGKFECPFCRHQHEAPPEGEDLNEHYNDCILLPQLSDLLQRQMLRNDKNSRPKVSHPICDSCNPAKHNEAVAWCDSCSQILCDECREMHDDRLLLKGHPLSTPLNSIDLSMIERKASCQKHRREDITWVCYEYQNAEYLCNECVRDGRHKDHTHVDLETETEKEKIELEDLLTNARIRNKQVIDRKDKLKSAIDTLKRNSDDVEMKIDTCQDKFMTMLQDHKEIKKCEFLEIKEEKSNTLKQQAQETNEWLSIFENIENEVDQLHHASPISKLENSKMISNALHEYLAIEIYDASTTNVYMEVKECNSYTKLQDLLDKATEITTRPSKFQIAHPAVAFQDHEFEVHIQSISNSEMCTIGGLPVRARLHTPSCSVHTNLELVPHDERNGKYVLRFTPKCKGLYRFHVYIEGLENPMEDVDVCVHLAKVCYDQLTLCDKTYQLRAVFKTAIDLDVLQNLYVECNGDAVQPQGIIYQPDFIAKFLPTKLGKIRTCITSKEMRIAGPFTTSVCKQIMWDCADNIILEEDAVTDIAVHKDGHVYLAVATPLNRKIISFNHKEEPVVANTVVSYQNKGTLFISFDKYGKLFVLNVTNNDTDTATAMTNTKTELQIRTPDGNHSYSLKPLISPGGLAVSPSGSLVAISDQNEHRVCLFQTPEGMDNKSISPFKVLGENGNDWGQFVNPTAICIKTDKWLFVCDKGNGRIQELDMNGNTVHVYGSVRRLRHPEAICLSPGGHLIILDGEKLVAIDSCCRTTLCEIEISCKGGKCNFNHLIGCLPDCQVLCICCGNNDMNIFRYAVSQR